MAETDIPHPGLYTDLYQLTMSQGYYQTGLYRKKAYFDFFFRNAPFDGEYVVFAGLMDLLTALDSFHYSKEEVTWLNENGFEKNFCDFLENYRFDGTVVSVREGEMVFPGEPVLTVSGPLLSCQLVESLLLNILNFQSLIATKARRLRWACRDRQLADFGLRRAQGTGSLHASRAAYIGGVHATSNVLAGYRYNIPMSGTMAHSWIQCFDSELDAFRNYARIYPDSCILLVDTYHTLESGIPNAVTVGKELEKKGHRLKGVRLDSGNPLELSKKVRAMLDKAGLSYVAIAVSDQLDEKSITSLLDHSAPVDYFGVGTRLITGYPDAALSGVYKICSLDQNPTMKITEESSKSNLPGIKEILRESDRDGWFRRDHIVLADTDGNTTFTSPSTKKELERNDNPLSGEVVTGNKPSSSLKEPIRHCVMESGQTGQYETNLEHIVTYSQSRFQRLPDEIKRLSDPVRYEIRRHASMETLIEKLKRYQ